jgi:hypothetical protein
MMCLVILSANSLSEALIGLGSILGPGCGAIAGQLRPRDAHAPIIAVAAILWASVIAARVVSIQRRRGAAGGQ